MIKAAFLDRDDTIIVDIPYLDNPDRITLLPNAVEGLKEMMARGYTLILITNQSGIGRGYFTEETLAKINGRLCEILEQHGVTLARIYYCPHAPEAKCSCRKPATGMLEQACNDFSIDLKNSVMIGDGKGDIGLAQNFGITGIQVTNGKKDPIPGATRVCQDLLEAARTM